MVLAREGATTALRGRRRALQQLVVAAVFVVALVGLAVRAPRLDARPHPARASSAPARDVRQRSISGAAAISLPFATHAGRSELPGPYLAPGSDPRVLPGDVLVADEGNDRLVVVDPEGNVVWRFPRRGDLPSGTTFLSPDDAFFSPGGSEIIATEESDQVVSLVSVSRARLLWRFGQPGVPGSGPDQLSNPDDAMLLPNGDVVIADIKNCSILVTRVGMHAPLERLGAQDTACYHAPPQRFGSPNGAFPLPDGNYLVTEINGDWVDEMSLSGKILWSTHPPGVAYPSDTNEISPGVFLTVDYSTPGQIVEFDRHGRLLWRYGPTSGPGMLRTPSLCEPVPTNGDILCNDDGNDRVVVIDPRTDRIVWQYGHDGVPGSAPGYLSGPDGVDLAPPYSMLARHSATIGLPSLVCATGLPPGACTVFAHR